MPRSHVVVGSNVGGGVGGSVGDGVDGESVGAFVALVGCGLVGMLLGSGTGMPVGSGELLGRGEGTPVGRGEVGMLLGSGEGTLLGLRESVGSGEGRAEGLSSTVGSGVGAHVWVEGSVSQHRLPNLLPVVTCQPSATPDERAMISVGT
mmetsp:Transcript_93587/g.267771  ORF Transcript_93587/g.267771 Transcript_93587/m.267771 type:complete len:149 (+) Transcript_93587:2668-3114(+)